MPHASKQTYHTMLWRLMAASMPKWMKAKQRNVSRESGKKIVKAIISKNQKCL